VSAPVPCSDPDRRLLDLAHDSIDHGLHHGRPATVDLADQPEVLRQNAASFVTLRDPGAALRGCIGQLEPDRALAESVVDNAFKAAFRDPRFAPLAREELAELSLHISVLGPLVPLDVDCLEALHSALVPGRDGLLLQDGPHRATFLPEVWRTLGDPRAFVNALWLKAGLSQHHWSGAVRAWRYSAREIGD